LDKITVEVSVLTPPRRVKGPEEIVIGVHGIILSKNGRSATYLPQVAPEQGWDRETTLKHLARKAGIGKDYPKIDELEEILAEYDEELYKRMNKLDNHIREIYFKAYPIDKNERGYYQVIYYSVAPSAISEIERRFRINEDLLRFVTIKYDTNREITAWNKLVEKANKAATPTKEEAKVETEATETTEAPAEQEA
jgi:ribosomal protein S6